MRGKGGEARVVLARPIFPSLWFADGYISPEAIELLEKANDDIRKRIEVQVGATSEREGLALGDKAGSIRLLPEQPTSEFDMLGETPLCDLVLLGQSTFRSLGVWSGQVTGALMQARLPFMIVRHVPASRRIAAIAWDGSQGAGRAVRAAIPMLKAASKVIILQDPEHISPAHRPAADPERLADYLQLHGVQAIETVSRPGMSRADGLGVTTRQLAADVLIAGAFGHARLLEAVFGGATNSLLEPSGDFNLLLVH
jgi:nucleotide-binding universal stress UspA family protein